MARAEKAVAAAAEPVQAAPERDFQSGPEVLFKLIADCNTAYAAVESYSCTFSKQELFQGELKPAEIMDAKFRKPHSVSLVWRNGILRNRRVIYVPEQNDGKLLVYTGNLPAFRKVFRIPVDAAEVARENHHSITELGVGHLCLRMREQFDAARTAGKLDAKYLGIETVDGRKTWHISRRLEDGGRREWNVDVELVLPTRVATFDKDGKLLETYSYSDIKLNPGLKDEDFDPDKVFF